MLRPNRYRVMYPNSMRLIKRLSLFIALFLVTGTTPETKAQDLAGERYALLIGGLGGSPDYTTKFKGYLYDTRKALIDEFQFDASRISVLGETSIAAEDFVDAISNAENIRAAFGEMASKITTDDQFYVFLFGHGGYEGGEARLNIPRRDLSQNDFASLVGDVSANRVIFVNTGSASAPFIEALSGEGRIVVTATRTGTQKNETFFPGFMVDAFTNPGTDRDKDGRISVAEVFLFAAEKTDQWFADNGNLPTENALLDDNSDQEGHRVNELAEGGEGHLAGITYLSVGGPAIASASGGDVPVEWLREKAQIEQDIAELKSQKTSLAVDDYYQQLEVLFVRLARGNEAAEN